MPKLTIREIAQLADVSIGTVSRVLNNQPGVSEEKRAAILELVGQTGFIPNVGARRLAQGKMHQIGICPSGKNPIRYPFFGYLLDAIQECVFLKGYGARVLEAELDESTLNQFSGFIVPGIYVDDSRIRTLKEWNLPFSIQGCADNSVAWVAVDNQAGMQLAVEHLLRLGHREIIHLSSMPSVQGTFERLQGYRAALQAAQIPYNPAMVLDGDFSEVGAYRAIRKALEQNLSFSAIAAASDEMATGAMLALSDAGLRVPYDISVTGFDDLPLARYSHPPLTTVQQPIREIGFKVAELLLEQLEGLPVRQVLIKTQLIVRSSSAPRP